MSVYAIFDVEIKDKEKYEEYMNGVKPAIESVGARYLVRGGAHQVIEGDWNPKRLVIIEFPSLEAGFEFYNSPIYQGLKVIRDECSSANLVVVEGV